MDFQEGVVLIALAREQAFQFHAFQFGFHLNKLVFGLSEEFCFIFFFRDFNHFIGIGNLFFQGFHAVDSVIERGAFGQEFLGSVGVFSQIGILGKGF